MSVYTPVDRQQLETFLTHYEVGYLIHYQGIRAGIENTNYFVTTSQGEFVLTLFEQHAYDELPYFLELMAYLAEHQVPSAHPLADKEAQYLRYLNGKPAALVQRLQGHDVETPTLIQCHALGQALGHLHVVGLRFPLHRENSRGPRWWNITAKRVFAHLKHEEALLLEEELCFQANYKDLDLPRGVIHADLFRDNALFKDNILSGIIDFYYACSDVLLFDVAVTINDWCSLPDGQLDRKRLQVLLEGYCQKRELTKLEQQIWGVMLRAAALRFWLSRLQDLHFPRPGEITHIKNPDVFRDILQARKEETELFF
jgi:homoserine kinase type II